MSKDRIRALLERVSGWLKQAQEELVRAMTEAEARYGRIYLVDDDERAPSTSSARITSVRCEFLPGTTGYLMPGLAEQEGDAVFDTIHFTYYTSVL